MNRHTPAGSVMRAIGIALALVAMLATTALAAPPPGRGGPPEGAGPPEGRGPDRPTPVSPVGVSVTDASATEGSPVVFPIALDQVANTDVTVEYATSDGSALADTHYTGSSGQAVIPAGSQDITVPVATIDDTDENANRTFTLVLTAVSNNGTLVDDTATGTIVDDDQPPVGGSPTVDVGDVSVAEGEVAVFPVTLSGPASTDVVLTYSTADGTASSADGTATTAKDYEAVTGGTTTILQGATSGSIEIATYDDLGPNDVILDADGYDEPDETFTVEVTGLTGDATLGDAIGEATIVDDDDPPVLTLLSRSVSESSGSASVTIDVFGRSSEVITVDWSAGSEATDTATEDADYTPGSGTVEIPAGFTTGVISGIPLIDDGIIEEAETFTVTISNVSSNASIAVDGDTATVTITDDDGTMECTSVDTHEDDNDTPESAAPMLERTETIAGETSWACQGDHDWWMVGLDASSAGTEVVVHVEGTNLGHVGDLVVEAQFDPDDPLALATPLQVEGGSDGWTVLYHSDGTPGRVLVDLLLPGSDPDVGIQYLIAYSTFSEPEP